jgi:DNA polymerase I
MEFKLWQPGDPVTVSRKLALDTETELIEGRHKIPDVVTLQVYGGGDDVQVVMWQDILRYLDEMRGWNPSSHYIFHNCAFDIPVLGYPKFLMDAVDEGRVHDTMLRYALYRIYEGESLDCSLSLQTACKDILNVNVAKGADVRLSFKRGMELNQDQLAYAAKDAVYTFLLNEAIPHEKTVTEDIQVRAALALEDISRRGFLVDEERRASTESMMLDKIASAKIVMADNGYIPGKKGNKTVLQNLIKGYVEMYGIDKYPRTAKSGALSTSGESLALLPVEELPFLTAYNNHDHFNKIVMNWLSKENLGPDGRIRTRFKTLVVTGRTSSSEPNLQNLPREGNVRGIFIPPEGKVLCAIDYSQLELCSLAQHCLCKYGFSRLAEYINSGRDVHKYLASLNYGVKEEDIDWKSLAGKKMRQSAKISNFGYPGGLSAKTFVGYAKGYGLNISLDESQKLRNAWLKAFPEMEKHLQPDYDSENDAYVAKTQTGRIRGKCGYTESLNSVFQGLASDGFKLALWECFRRKIPIVDQIHDEILFELDIDTPARMTEKVKEVQDIMVREMKMVLPDIVIKTEACLMDRWMKIDGEKDDNGDYIVIKEKDILTKKE